MRKMGPMTSDHPLVTDNKACPGCDEIFKAGDYVTLIPIGPGDNAEARARARDDRAYNAVAVPVHWACATGGD